MRKVILLVCVTILSALLANAQDLNVGISAGIAFPEMKGARSSLTNKLNSLPFEAGITDNFPAWFEYKAEVSADFDKVMFGIYLIRSTAGGRISSRDFSANYFYNIKMRNVAFGFSTKLLIDELHKTRLFISIGAGAQNLNSNINEELLLYSNNKKVVYKNSKREDHGFHAIVGFNAEKKITNNISVATYLNYYLSPAYTRSSNYYSGNWKGFRTGLTFCLIIPEKIEKYSKVDQ
jgi:hypothetical protein